MDQEREGGCEGQMEGQEWGVGGTRQQVREGTTNVKMRYSNEFELQTDTYAGRETIGGGSAGSLSV